MLRVCGFSFLFWWRQTTRQNSVRGTGNVDEHLVQEFSCLSCDVALQHIRDSMYATISFPALQLPPPNNTRTCDSETHGCLVASQRDGWRLLRGRCSSHHARTERDVRRAARLGEVGLVVRLLERRGKNARRSRSSIHLSTHAFVFPFHHRLTPSKVKPRFLNSSDLKRGAIKLNAERRRTHTPTQYAHTHTIHTLDHTHMHSPHTHALKHGIHMPTQSSFRSFCTACAPSSRKWNTPT